MSITVRESLSQVKGMVKEVNADSRLSNKFVYNKLITKAMLLIQRESDTLKLAWLTEMYQTITCLKIEEAPAIDPCCGIKSKAVVYRSVNPLPEIYSDTRGLIINNVSSLDGYKQIELTTPASIRRIAEDTNSKYDKTIYGWIFDGYLYLLKKYPVKITAAFITDVSDYNDCSCEEAPCKRFLDSVWKIPKKLMDVTIQLVVVDILKEYKALREDGKINKKED